MWTWSKGYPLGFSRHWWQIHNRIAGIKSSKRKARNKFAQTIIQACGESARVAKTQGIGRQVDLFRSGNLVGGWQKVLGLGSLQYSGAVGWRNDVYRLKMKHEEQLEPSQSQINNFKREYRRIPQFRSVQAHPNRHRGTKHARGRLEHLQ